MADDLARIGSRVRVERERRGLSQEQLGERADLHRTYVGGLERGERNVSILNMLRIARALQVTVGELVDDDPV